MVPMTPAVALTLGSGAQGATVCWLGEACSGVVKIRVDEATTPSTTKMIAIAETFTQFAANRQASVASA